MTFLTRHRFLWLTCFVYFILAVILNAELLSDEKLVGENYSGSLAFWTSWFPPHALRYNLDLSYNAYSLYPIRTNLLPILSLPTSAMYTLLNIIFGSRLAFNLLFPLYLTLTAWLGCLWLRRQVDNAWLAILGGGVLAFNPLSFAIAERGEIALLGWWVFPLWMLAWDAFLERMTFRRLVLVVAGLYLTVLMSIQFWNLILTVLLPYALFRWYMLGCPGGKLADYLLVGLLLFAALFLLYPASALLWSTYELRYAPIIITNGSSLPTTFFLVGLILLGLSLLLPWAASPRRRWWLAVIAVNGLLVWQVDFSPLTVLGNLFAVPHNPELTHPALYGFPVILGGVVLLGQGIHFLIGKERSWLFIAPPMRYSIYGGMAALVVIASGWLGELPTTPAPSYNFYQTLAADPENYLVIDYPFGIDSLARRHGLATGEDVSGYGVFGQWEIAGRSLLGMPEHHKRVLGGLTVSLTADALAPYHASALIQLLALGLDPAAPDIDAQVPTLKNEVIRWRAGYVLIHRDELPPEALDRLRGWFIWTDTFCYAGEENGVEVWRGTWHPAGCPAYTLNLGESAGDLAIGSGWQAGERWETGAVRWAGPALSSTLKLWITNPSSDYTLTIRAMSTDAIPDQSVEVFVNGESLGKVTLDADWADYQFTIPRLLIAQGGLLNLELRHSRSQVVDGRELTAVYQWVRIEAATPN
jgi:hypothetical protein